MQRVILFQQNQVSERSQDTRDPSELESGVQALTAVTCAFLRDRDPAQYRPKVHGHWIAARGAGVDAALLLPYS